MTSQQLQTARAERWRQKQNPVLTLEEATEWLNTVGFCLFLPRRTQFQAPAPSFVEATIGTPSETPAREQIDNATSLMMRMVDAKVALPLNLLGTLSEQPDFLVSPEVFPYLFSLRGGRNWKTVPPKASPLVAEIWKLLDKKASLEVTELAAALGREITESAVLRSLMDLWSTLRVMPIFSADEPTKWQLTQTRFEEALNMSNKTAQSTALSALVSLYLDSVVAAGAEDVETFLSPVTSRSKARDVVNGLAATRQLAVIPVGAQLLFHVAGSLPEFADEPEETITEITLGGDQPRSFDRRPSEGRERRDRDDRPARPAARGFGDRPGRTDRPARTDRPTRSGGSDRPFGDSRNARGEYPARRKTFGAASSDRPARKPFGTGGDRPARRPFGAGDDRPARKPFGTGGDRPARKPFGDRDKPFPRREGGDQGERRSFGSSAPRRGPAGGTEGGFRKPFRPRPEGAPGGDRPYRPRTDAPGEGRSFSRPREEGKRPFFRDKPSFAPRSGGSRPGRSGSGGPREGGDRSFGKPFGKPFRPRTEGGAEGGARPYRPRTDAPGEGRSFSRPREEGKRPFFRDKTGGGESRPRRFEGGDDQKRGGFSKPRSAGTGRPSFGDRPRPSFGDRPRPSFGDKPRSSSRPSFGDRPRSGSRPSFGDKPKFGDRPSFGDRPKFGARSEGRPPARSGPRPPSKFGSKPGARPAGKFGSRPPSKFGSKPGFKSAGGKFGSKPGFKSGPKPGSRPGGTHPPFGKRKDKGGDSGE